MDQLIVRRLKVYEAKLLKILCQCAMNNDLQTHRKQCIENPLRNHLDRTQKIAHLIDEQYMLMSRIANQFRYLMISKKF